MPRDEISLPAELRPDAASPCGCLVRFLAAPQNPTGCPWIANAMLQVAGLQRSGAVCSVPCGRELRTIVVAERAKRLKRPFLAEWRRAYLPIILASILMPDVITWWLP